MVIPRFVRDRCFYCSLRLYSQVWVLSVQAKEAAIDALASLSHANSELSQTIANYTSKCIGSESIVFIWLTLTFYIPADTGENPVNILLSLVRDKSPSVRLGAVTWQVLCECIVCLYCNTNFQSPPL